MRRQLDKINSDLNKQINVLTIQNTELRKIVRKMTSERAPVPINTNTKEVSQLVAEIEDLNGLLKTVADEAYKQDQAARTLQHTQSKIIADLETKLADAN